MTTWPRFLLALALLLGAGLFLHSRSRPEVAQDREPTGSFPTPLGDWEGRTVALEPEVLEVLGKGDFLQRIYHRRPDEPPVDFFLAYFPSQRTGETVHSPQNCLPGAGWTPAESARVQLQTPSGESITVNRYVIAKGSDRQLVFYWYQSHGRVIASEYWAKFYLVADAIRLNRTDGALVRIITPMARGEERERAEKRAAEFLREILPLLDRFIPE